MSAKDLMLGETSAAHFTGELFLTVMNEHVALEVGFLVKCLIAQTTSVRSQTRMSEYVCFQVVLLKKQIRFNLAKAT